MAHDDVQDTQDLLTMTLLPLPGEPDYDWAGTTISQEMVYQCSVCGSLLRASMQELHTTWHQTITQWLVMSGLVRSLVMPTSED